MELPPAVIVPTSLIYHPAMSPAVLATWIKLRSLACTDDETLPLSIPELVAITGRRPSSLYNHLAFLRSLGAFTWRSCGIGSFIVSFKSETSAAGQPAPAIPRPSQPEIESEYLESDSRNLEDDSRNPENHSKNLEDNSRNLENPSDNLENNSRNLENGSRNLEFASRKLDDRSKNLETRPPSYPPSFFSSFFYSKINPLQEQDQLKREGKFQNPGIASQQSSEGGPPASVKSHPRLACPENPAVNQYRQHTGLRPSRLQRQLLTDQISDLEVWAATLKHWLAHGWNPRNITGQLELYQRGGPPACRYCRKENLPEDSTLQIIQHMQREADHYPQ